MAFVSQRTRVLLRTEFGLEQRTLSPSLRVTKPDCIINACDVDANVQTDPFFKPGAYRIIREPGAQGRCERTIDGHSVHNERRLKSVADRLPGY